MLNAYQIGIQITVNSHGANSGINSINQQLKGLQHTADQVHSKMSQLGDLVKGIFSVQAAREWAKIVGDVYDKAAQAAQNTSRMMQANIPAQDIEKLNKQAWNLTQTVSGFTVNAAQNLVQDLYDIMGGKIEEVLAASPALAKAEKVLAQQPGTSESDAIRQTYNLSKYLEEKGAFFDPVTKQIDQNRIEQQIRLAEAIIAGTKNRVDATQLYNFYKQGGASAKLLSDQGLENLAPIIQVFGGERTGTGLSSGQRQLEGGQKLYQQSVDWLEKFDLVNTKMVHKAKGGRFSIDPGAIAGNDEFTHDPVGWVKDVLIPAFQKKGITDPQKQVEALNSSGLLTTYTRIVSQILMTLPQLQAETGVIDRAKQVDQYDIAKNTSPVLAMQNMEAAFSNMVTAFGGPLVQPAIKAMNDLADTMNRITKWANDPKNSSTVTAIDGVGIGAGVLGGGFVGWKMLASIGRFLGIGGGGAAAAPAAAAGEGAAAAAGGGGLLALLGLGGLAVGGGLAGEYLTQGHPLLRTLLQALGPLGVISGGMTTKALGGVQTPSWMTGFMDWWSGKSHPASLDLNNYAFGKKPGDNTPPPPAPVTVQNQTIVNLDGKQIAAYVENKLAGMLNSANGGTSTVDSRLAPIFPGGPVWSSHN